EERSRGGRGVLCEPSGKADHAHHHGAFLSGVRSFGGGVPPGKYLIRAAGGRKQLWSAGACSALLQRKLVSARGRRSCPSKRRQGAALQIFRASFQPGLKPGRQGSISYG